MIERRDTIYTDSVVVGYPYPYHLAVKQDIIKVNGEDKKIYAQLYSVCFGEKTGVIYEEYPINEIENIEEAKAFHFELSNTKRQGIYPSTQLYPMDNLYPLMPDLNYIIFKYKLCYNNSDSTTSPEMIDIGKEYKVVFPCSKKDKLRISAYYDN